MLGQLIYILEISADQKVLLESVHIATVSMPKDFRFFGLL